MLRIKNIDKYFNKNKNNEIHVIDNTSLDFNDSGLVVLLGHSGSGKTTLLNVIGGLLGCSIFTILHKIENRLPDFLKKDWFYNIIVILVSLVFILYLFNFIKLEV